MSAKLKSMKEVKSKLSKYIKECEREITCPTIAGICLRLDISTKTFKEYREGLVPSLHPDIKDYMNWLYMWVQEYNEEVCVGFQDKGSSAGAKFLLANHHGMSEKNALEIDGNLQIYKLIEEEAQRVVQDFSEEKRSDIKQIIKKREEK
jgi:hypothetical protein